MSTNHFFKKIIKTFQNLQTMSPKTI